MACAAYPALHSVIFDNHRWLEIIDTFLMPTYSMVLAAPGTEAGALCGAHPAPVSLIPEGTQWVRSSSNSQAAIDGRNGLADSFITTSAAAERNDLHVIHDFGPVNMAFTVHGWRTHA